jgi:hypothetical protein
LNASSQTGPASTPRVFPLHEAPLPKTVFIDRDGDVWESNGHTADGELLLACPAPSNPEDFGDGPSFPWTLAKVERALGPLTARADVQERELVEVDTEFLDYFGPDWRHWKQWQVDQYLAAMGQARAAQAVAA